MISIIIPILNEEKNIGKLLPYLLDNSNPKNISEIIIVDGGSNDKSLNIVNNFITSCDSEQGEELSRETNQKGLDTLLKSKNTRPYIVPLKSEKGRAKQMNYGAKKATGSILYFLHADSFPPKNFDSHIIKEVEKGNLAGCFKMNFNSNHLWLKLAGWFTQFSWRACRGGDQSLFIKTSLFNDIGGFDEHYLIYEDNDFINKLYTKNQFVVIQEWLITSARRYNKYGITKLQYHYWVIYLKKWLGGSPEALYQYYLKHLNVK